jgi:fatty acyl-CoA reductase
MNASVDEGETSAGAKDGGRTSVDDDAGVAAFYDGKSVFLTGASGFVGKVLLEKLLWSCPGMEKVYILIRDKRGMSSEERVRQLLESKVRGYIFFSLQN